MDIPELSPAGETTFRPVSHTPVSTQTNLDLATTFSSQDETHKPISLTCAFYPHCSWRVSVERPTGACHPHLTVQQ